MLPQFPSISPLASDFQSSKLAHFSPPTMQKTAPAKIILSGEHAVVYGCPALAVAVNRFCCVKMVSSEISQDTPEVTFLFPDTGYQQTFTVSQLLLLQKQLQASYQDFLCGKLPHDAILASPYLFVAYAYSVFLVRLISLRAGKCFLSDGAVGELNTLLTEISSDVMLEITTDIPIGCGMGSSAALIVALGKALVANTTVDKDVFLTWAREIENLQHGVSSGLDLHVSYYGAGMWAEDGNYTQRNFPSLALGLVNTGKPQVTTGESVAMVRHHFTRGHLSDDFVAVTRAMDQACQSMQADEIRRCVYENHKLLCAIGVVPERAQSFITQIEKRGLAAKISGAGATSGDAVGIILITDGEGENSFLERIEDMVVKYGYEILQA